MNVTEYLTGLYMDSFHTNLLSLDDFSSGSLQPHINLETHGGCSYEYAKALNDTVIRNAGKTTFNFLSVGKLSLLLSLLPSLAEQKRIVAQLEELLPLCERLK